VDIGDLRGASWNVSISDASLSQRQGNYADGQKQNYIKGTAQKLRLDGDVNLFFHFSSLVEF
jgi:hypothetical protein